MNLPTMKLKLFSFFSESRSIYFTQPLFNASFYGIKAVFIFYAIQRLFLTEGEAIALYATFMALCYATALIGGHIADKYLGVKMTVVLGGILAGLGLLCVALFPSLDFCFFGLALMSLGSGCFKSNLLASIGLLFTNPKDPKKDRAYSLIYGWGNLGILTFLIIFGLVGKIWGWEYALILIALIFIGATALYYKSMQLHTLYKMTASRTKLCIGLFSLVVFLYAILKYRIAFHGMMGAIIFASICYLGVVIYQCNTEEKKGVLYSMTYVLLFACFVTVFEQSGSSLMLFYEKAVDLQLMGIPLLPSYFLSMNALFIIIFTPILVFLSGRYLEKTKPIHGLVKSGYGFLLTALSFWILAWGVPEDKVSLVPSLWVVASVLAHALGELWVVPVGLSKISQNSPQRFQSVMMSFWSLAIAYGHYAAGYIAQFSVAGAEEPITSFEHYRTFFWYVGYIPLTVGLTMLLCRIVCVYVFKTAKEKHNR